MLPASIQYCALWSVKGPKLYNENAGRAGRSFTARRAALWSNGAPMSALPLSHGRKRTTKMYAEALSATNAETPKEGSHAARDRDARAVTAVLGCFCTG
jgi:hypothetical protein